MRLTDVTKKLEINRRRIELDRIDAELRDNNNHSIVRAGRLAVKDGTVTRDTIADLTAKTIARHLAMMRHLGRTELPDASPYSFFHIVAQKSVRVDTGTFALLSQRADSASVSRELKSSVTTSGLATTLKYHASPRTTRIIFTREPDARSHMIVPFGPTGLSGSDEAFRKQWGPSFLTRDARFSSQAELEAMPPGSPPMNERDLVVTAGLNVIFNRLLDGVEAHM